MDLEPISGTLGMGRIHLGQDTSGIQGSIHTYIITHAFSYTHTQTYSQPRAEGKKPENLKGEPDDN